MNKVEQHKVVLARLNNIKQKLQNYIISQIDEEEADILITFINKYMNKLEDNYILFISISKILRKLETEGKLQIHELNQLLSYLELALGMSYEYIKLLKDS